MEKLEIIFKNWIDEKIENQLSIIDEICENTDLDPKLWFDEFINYDIGTHSGYDFLESLFDNFSVHLKSEFEKNFLKYVKPEGYNIYNQPYYGTFIDIIDKTEDSNIFFELSFDSDSQESLKNILEKLTLTEKSELMKNKIFSYVINKTKFNIFSKNDIRALKLRSLNECV